MDRHHSDGIVPNHALSTLPDEVFDSAKLLEGEDILNFEEDLDRTFVLCDAEDERGIDIFAEIRGVLDICRGEVEHLTNPVNNQADERLLAILNHLDNNDASLLFKRGFGESELHPKVYHRDNFTPKVNHPFQMWRHTWYAGNVLHAHDFPDVKDLNAKFFSAKPKGEVLARPRIDIRLHRDRRPFQ